MARLWGGSQGGLMQHSTSPPTPTWRGCPAGWCC